MVDRLTKYAHFFPITSNFKAYPIAELFFKEIFRLHGLPKNIVSDRDSRFLSYFLKKLFHLTCTNLTPSTSYHPQTNGQTEIVNKWIEAYLRSYVSNQQGAWVKWLQLGDHCYNTSHHMYIGMPPFRSLYSYDAFSFADLIFSDSRVPAASDFVKQSQEVLRSLKDNLHHAQNWQKMYADNKRTDRIFKVGDLVFVILQPYQQISLKRSGIEKLKPRFYGPYKIIRKIGEVAYDLELPPS